MSLSSPSSRGRSVSLIWQLVLFVALGLLGPVHGLAEETPDSRHAYETGVEFEQARKWIDAIEHYESALKQFPENKELEYGLRRSRVHYAIQRRYEDTSFERDMLPQSRNDSLALFDELLLQIKSHYVESISSTSFVAHGTESFYLALADDTFQKRNLPNADPERIAKVRKVLRDEFWNKPISDRYGARNTVSQVCDLAQSTLGLQSGPVVMEYIFGGCNALDDYSAFLTPDRLEDLYGNIEGEFVGLGIEMKAEEGSGLLLVNVIPESPAAEGGLLPGEYIVKIEEEDCRMMSTDQAARLLRGPTGSRVSLTIENTTEGRSRRATFLRRAVHVKSVSIAKIVDPQSGVAYIQLTGFQKSSASELDTALSELRRQGMKALILDVRGNPGGLLTAAVEIADRFITDGTIVSTRGRTLDQNLSYSAHRAGTTTVPMVLLVDGDSASASEILAGAMQDHKRATIVGRKTFGKWSVQSIFPIRGETGLRVTTAKFYSPKGRTLGKIGVDPDVAVQLPSDRHVAFYRSPLTFNAQEDPDLQKGLDVLRGQISQR